MIGIYKITNKINGKCYIGQSRDIESRWRAHKARKGTYIYNAFQKYGVENFTFEVLEECEKERLNELEKYYIKLYHSFGEGYNLCEGGNSDPKDFDEIRKQKISKATRGRESPTKGKPMSDNTKEKLRQANLGRTPWNKGIPASEEAKEKNRQAHLGKSHPHRKLTEEEKIKISKTLTGRKLPEETKKKMSIAQRGKPHKGVSIVCISTNEKFVSMSECSRKHRISRADLKKLLDTGEESKEGLMYRYEEN